MSTVDKLPMAGDEHNGGVVKRASRTPEGLEVTYVVPDDNATRPVDPGPLTDPQAFVYEGVPEDQQEAAFLGIERSADSIGAAPDGSRLDEGALKSEDNEDYDGESGTGVATNLTRENGVTDEDRRKAAEAEEKAKADRAKATAAAKADAQPKAAGARRAADK